MATTTNYAWETPDDTDLVKDGAAAIRTLGSSIDTTTKALNPSTTLGDIEYRSATANTNTRLPIGTNGQILTVAAGLPSWAAAPTTGDNWTLLNAGGTALTGAQTVTVSGISGRNKIMVLIAGASSAGANAEIGIRPNNDSAANYVSYGAYIEAPSTYSASSLSGFNASSTTYIKCGSMGTNAASVVNGGAILEGCNSSGVKAFQSNGSGNAAGGNTHAWQNFTGVWTGSATVSSISIFSQSGNLDAGTVFVYATN